DDHRQRAAGRQGGDAAPDRPSDTSRCAVRTPWALRGEGRKPVYDPPAGYLAQDRAPSAPGDDSRRSLPEEIAWVDRVTAFSHVRQPLARTALRTACPSVETDRTAGRKTGGAATHNHSARDSVPEAERAERARNPDRPARKTIGAWKGLIGPRSPPAILAFPDNPARHFRVPGVPCRRAFRSISVFSCAVRAAPCHQRRNHVNAW